jgi:enterochelin esterase-like enzyme
VALHGGGSFYVYLPPGYHAHPGTRYPVLYLLHGNSQPATAFLQIGLQGTLDHLIAERVVPPLIAVMVEGGHGADNWRNIHGLNYDSYVLEAQEMVDRMLPTIASRNARAIAGDSMGGYGAMNLALGNPARFGVVESWIGFFNGLEGEVRLDKPVISHLGLHAYLYGAAEDTIADPSENAPFAAELRAAGADAQSGVFQGEHSLETVQAYLPSMLHYAGRWLATTSNSSGSKAASRADPTG